MTEQEQQAVDPKNLHVPNSKSFSAGLGSIMDAYRSQSKVEIGMSEMDKDGNVQATKDIPLSALQPRQTVIGADGKPQISKSSIAEGIKANKDIMNAYRQMNGEEPVDESDIDLMTDEEGQTELPEQIPEGDDELLQYMATLIDNFRKNLNSLENLYCYLAG